MEDLIIWGLITFIFYCFDCYVVKRNMRPDTTNKELITLFAGILGGGILIILMMYYAYINLNFFSWYISPVALIPLFFCSIMAVSRIKTRGRSQNTKFILTNHNICVISDSRNNSRSDNIWNLPISWMKRAAHSSKMSERTNIFDI